MLLSSVGNNVSLIARSPCGAQPHLQPTHRQPRDHTMDVTDRLGIIEIGPGSRDEPTPTEPDSPEDGQKKHGEQFSDDRFKKGQENEDILINTIEEVFDPLNITAVEPDNPYDNYAAEKELHQLIDYSATDYMLDRFEQALTGINHRTHTPTSSTLRFDMRADTGTQAPAELKKLLNAERGDFVPKFATRMKQAPDGGVEWIRVVHLFDFVDAIEAGELEPVDTWHGTDKDDNYVVANMYDYDELRELGVVINEFHF